MQVYLGADEADRLDRLAEQLETTKSDVMRRGLLALERDVMDPLAHPALRLIGLASAERGDLAAEDVARNHDAVFAETEERSWFMTPAAPAPAPAPARKRRRRGR